MTDQLRHAAAALAVDLGDAPAGRMDELSDALAATLRSVRDAAKAATDAITATAAGHGDRGDEDPQWLAAARMTLAMVDDLQRTAGRILAVYDEELAAAARKSSGSTGRSPRTPGVRPRCGWRRSRSARYCGNGCSASVPSP